MATSIVKKNYQKRQQHVWKYQPDQPLNVAFSELYCEKLIYWAFIPYICFKDSTTL